MGRKRHHRHSANVTITVVVLVFLAAVWVGAHPWVVGIRGR